MSASANPHLERLKKHRNWEKLNLLFDPNNLAIWVMLMIAGSCFAAGDAFYLADVRFWVLVARVFVVIIGPIAWLMAGAAAYFTNADIRANRLDLLRLTPLREGQLVWGYIGATLFRFRYVVRVTFGSMVFTLVCMFVAGLGSNIPYIAGDYVVMWTAFVVHYYGMCLAVVFIMVTLALRVSYAKVLGIWLPLVAVTAIFLSFSLSLQVVETRLSQAVDMRRAVRDGVILAITPYLVVAGSWQVAQRWAKQD